MLFNTTKSLIFKNGASSSVGELLARQGLVKPFVVTDSFLNSSGLLDSCLSSIKNAESKAVVFDQVVPDPTESNVLAATEMARANGCDSVIGFGGGSPMDVAKVSLCRRPSLFTHVCGPLTPPPPLRLPRFLHLLPMLPNLRWPTATA